MTSKQNEIKFTVNLENDLLERLTIMAEHGKLSRHKMMVNILKEGIKDVGILEHVGIFQIAILVRNMTESPDKASSRKSLEEKASEMPIPLRIDKSFIDRLEVLAVKGGLSRQRLAQNIIKTGLEELEAAKRIGLTHVVLKITDMTDLFANVIKIGKQAFFAGKEVKPK